MTGDQKLEAICYKRNFITEVIFRIDYVIPIPSLAEALPTELRDAILKSFPLPEPKKIQGKEIQLGPPGVSTKDITQSEWHFHSADRQKSVVITQECLFLKYQIYSTFDSFKTEADAVFGAFFKAYPNTLSKRTGFRIINNIKADTKNLLDWQGLISDELIQTFKFSPGNGQLARAFHNIEFNFGDFNMRMLFGIHNRHYPAPVREKSFILDFDAYRSGVCDPAELPTLLHRFHECIQAAFEKSIQSDLRGILMHD